ncbi:helix-turn-helix domain-containing protein [Leifsonia sp. NPDC014704]|uniref:helix-turn-helix domain-containing protein n=1 Tax=Leifsonia sp. NPDC014704 TaxID=3364123 RepID=UPI0036F47640
MSQSTTPLRRVALAGEIRAEMARQRVSVAQLADATGISQSTLYRRLNGVKPLQLEELDAICASLKVSLVALTERAKTAGAA